MKEENQKNKEFFINYFGKRNLTPLFFKVIGPVFKEVKGGYVRVIKLGKRDSDGADIARVEWTKGYRARIRNHGHSCFLCEIGIRSQFHTTYEPEA
jgi:LSU ribosomal protein L17P